MIANAPRTGPLSSVEYRIANHRWHRDAAYRLVYRSYLRAGLIAPLPHGRWVTPYLLLPSTQTFVAIAHGPASNGKVVSTLSLVADSDLGLPMETVYGREVALRRAEGLRLAEVTCLADRRADLRRFLDVFSEMTRMMAHFARHHAIDQLLAMVHPRHARFYTRHLGFMTMGPKRNYHAVGNNPAVALSLDFARVDRERPKCYPFYFGESIAVERLAPQPISPAEVAHFQKMIAPVFQDRVPLQQAAPATSVTSASLLDIQAY